MATTEGERRSLLPPPTTEQRGSYDALHQAKPSSIKILVPPPSQQSTLCNCECDCECERGVPIITSIHLHSPRHQHSLSPSHRGISSTAASSVPIAVLMTFMTLFMSVVGAGLLSIPFTFTCAPVSVVVTCLVLVGLAMGYTAELLVRVHIATNVFTYARRFPSHHLSSSFRRFNGLAEVAFGSVFSKVVSATTIFAILGACVGCIEIVADLSPFLVHLVGLDNTSYHPTSIVLPLFIAGIYPLTLLKKITALRFSSYVGFVASMYLVVAVTCRASSFSASSRASSAANNNHSTVVRPPSYDNLPLKVAHIVSVFNYAFVSHLNVIPLFATLQHATPSQLLFVLGPLPSKTGPPGLMWMRVVIYTMSLFCIGMYAVFGTHAMALYGNHVQGNILLNLEHDRVMDVPRLAVLVTILFSFPLLFHPFRMLVESFALQLVGCESKALPRSVQAAESLVLLLVVVAVATAMPGIQITFSLTGASCVTLICYVFPVLCYLRLCPHDSALRRGIAVVIGVFGLATGIVATGLVLTGTTVV
ncbi:hypothetical protein DYB26_002273 [Aphanomyces astaci]|uniref:Amino acid transporter transmembrane domain-containing protein n=1 Tax=Aphanomyces astaci TaxID=112090 RepID=A0A397CBR1_APHAT|nr:hypothetical protein DYB38_002778 [Aphanomyces astaci]RHZ06593.1 hypothetical protein DYB26_002273 [Aphanomyces astaci]